MTNLELIRKFKQKYFITIAWRLSSHINVLDKELTPDEEVNYLFAGQRENLLGATAVVAITNKRVLLVTARIFGGAFIHDLDIPKSKVFTGLFWGRVEFTEGDNKLLVSCIDKDAMSEIANYLSF